MESFDLFYSGDPYVGVCPDYAIWALKAAEQSEDGFVTGELAYEAICIILATEIKRRNK